MLSLEPRKHAAGYTYCLGIRLEIVCNFSPRWTYEFRLVFFANLSQMVRIRVAWKTELLSITESPNASARRGRILGPLPASMCGLTNGKMWNGLIRLVSPFDA